MPILDKTCLKTPEETTLEGRVEILGDFPRDRFAEASGVKHCGLLLKTDAGRLIIHLGPAGYFIQNNFQIRAGDTLEVTGVKVVQDQMPVIQAREVKNRQQRLKLRDRSGLPLWPAAGERLL
jgi:hypothetical protein